MENEEEWRKIENYPGYYISSLGRLRLLNGRISDVKPHDSGYIRYNIVNNLGKNKSEMAHQLVAKAFISNPENKKFVDHIDRDRSNNIVSNLRWVTTLENNLNKNNKEVIKGKPINQYDMNGQLIFKWENSSIIVNTFPFLKREKIYQSCKDGYLYNGYYWRYNYEILQNEIWKPILVYGNIIYVSSLGRVQTTKGDLTYGTKSAIGYYSIQIFNRNFQVHRLICLAFNYKDGWEEMVVDHIDSNKENNQASNLEFVTHLENMLRVDNKDLKCRKVCQFDLNGNLIKIHESIKNAAESINSTPGGMNHTCKGKHKNIKYFKNGYYWRYYDEYFNISNKEYVDLSEQFNSLSI